MNEKTFAVQILSQILPAAGVLIEHNGKWVFRNVNLPQVAGLTTRGFESREEAISYFVDQFYTQYAKAS